jgi:hypothetical protein
MIATALRAGVAVGGGISAAAATTDGFDPWSLLTTGGPVGVLVAVFWMLVTGKLHTDGEVKRLIAAHVSELDRARRDTETERAQRIALQSTLTGEVMPALTRSTDAATRSTDLMESMARRQAGGG